MDWLRVLLSRCAAFIHPQKLDADLDEELLAHIELATEENRKRGVPEEEARTRQRHQVPQEIRGSVAEWRDLRCAPRPSQILRGGTRDFVAEPNLDSSGYDGPDPSAYIRVISVGGFGNCTPGSDGTTWLPGRGSSTSAQSPRGRSAGS
jgi:hypothetical protein